MTEEQRERKRLRMVEWRAARRAATTAYNRAYADARRAATTAYNRAYADAHREEKRARDRAYHAAHRDELLAKRRATHGTDGKTAEARAARRDRDKAYYAAHRETKLKRDRAYYAAHPEEMAAKRWRKRVNGSARRHAATYYAKHRVVILAKAATNQVSLAGQLVTISTLPPELRDLALLIREARQVLRRAS